MKNFALNMVSLAAAFPTLHVAEKEGKKHIRGSFPVMFEGKVLDRFSIDIKLELSGPNDLPVVREINGRIPWNIDRHVNDDGTACVCLPEDYFLKHPGRLDVLTFLQDPIHQYFLGQALVERGDPWPQGEWGHGSTGQKEFYLKLIGSDDPGVVTRYLDYLGRPKLKGHWVCPCGNGKKIRDCHRNNLNELRNKITVTSAKQMLFYAKKWQREQISR